MLGPYADSSELSYATTLSYTMDTIQNIRIFVMTNNVFWNIKY